MLKKTTILRLASSVLLAAAFNASAAWYQVSFTGADLWNASADNAGQSRTDQTAPRVYANWPAEAVDSTWVNATFGVNNNGAAVGFAPPNGFAFDALNLWGKGGSEAQAWGEKYIAGNAGNGVSAWTLVQAPTGWTGNIVPSDPGFNPGPGAFPQWQIGTGTAIGPTTQNLASYVFTYDVLISNPLTAFNQDGSLRVFFGGFSDDQNGTGPDTMEVKGTMNLTATPVPEVGTMACGAISLALTGLFMLRRGSKK